MCTLLRARSVFLQELYGRRRDVAKERDEGEEKFTNKQVSPLKPPIFSQLLYFKMKQMKEINEERII